jgi:hypothetical protein
VPDLYHEWWLAKKLSGDKLCTMFCGVTDPEIRRDRMRQAIIDRGIENEMIPKSKTTFGQAFNRLYGTSIAREAA